MTERTYCKMRKEERKAEREEIRIIMVTGMGRKKKSSIEMKESC